MIDRPLNSLKRRATNLQEKECFNMNAEKWYLVTMYHACTRSQTQVRGQCM